MEEIFKELPSDLTSSFLLEYKQSHEKQLIEVTQKVSEFILSHQPTYVDELRRIADLQASITESIQICSQGRSCLKTIKEGTANGLTVVEHQRRRESLFKLIASLGRIKSLSRQIPETVMGTFDKEEAIRFCDDILEHYPRLKCIEDICTNSLRRKCQGCLIS